MFLTKQLLHIVPALLQVLLLSKRLTPSSHAHVYPKGFGKQNVLHGPSPPLAAHASETRNIINICPLFLVFRIYLEARSIILHIKQKIIQG